MYLSARLGRIIPPVFEYRWTSPSKQEGKIAVKLLEVFQKDLAETAGEPSNHARNLKKEKRSENLGLTQKEAERLLEREGNNVLASAKKISALKIFLNQFKDILVVILLISTVISACMGEMIEAAAIAVIVVLDGILGFVQEFRTERTLEALKKMAAPTARVYRDGVLVDVPASELVVGELDLVVNQTTAFARVSSPHKLRKFIRYLMSRRPRRKSDGVFSGGLLRTILFRGCLIGLTTLAVFVTIYDKYQLVEFARTAAFLTLVLTQLIHVFECKSETKSIFNIPYFNNIKLILAVLLSAAVVFATIYVEPLQAVFSTVALSGVDLLVIGLYCLVVPVLSGAFKALTKRFARRPKEN